LALSAGTICYWLTGSKQNQGKGRWVQKGDPSGSWHRSSSREELNAPYTHTGHQQKHYIMLQSEIRNVNDEKLELFLIRDCEQTFCRNVSTFFGSILWAHTVQMKEIKQNFKEICNGKKVHSSISNFLTCVCLAAPLPALSASLICLQILSLPFQFVQIKL